MTTETVTGLRFLAEYQRYGEPHEGWMEKVLQPAKDAGSIQDFNVTNVLDSGPWGIEIIDFTVDIPIVKGDEWHALDYDTTKDRMRDILNKIVGDDDLMVRYVGPIYEAEP